MNFQKLSRRFQGSLKLNEPLSRHTTFKIGGNVKIWAQPYTIGSLRLLLDFASKEGLPILIIGGGSNLLITDLPLKAIAINLSCGYFSKMRFDLKGVVAGAGVKISDLINRSIKAKRSGVEFLSGVPGTVGGVICTNAATLSQGSQKAASDILEEVKIMTAEGELKTLKRKDMQFDYRSSNLFGCIILQARLRLGLASGKKIKNLILENIKRKQNTQDLNRASAGCIFKNPSKEVANGLTAGFLIDKAGFKGRRVGQAMVSRQHANFIINTGKARASDVIKLLGLIRSAVKKKFAITLEPEIRVVSVRKKYLMAREIKFL